MILIDIPQVAYKTLRIEYIVRKDDGSRDRVLEYELEQNLQRRTLQGFPYSELHDHVR